MRSVRFSVYTLIIAAFMCFGIARAEEINKEFIHHAGWFHGVTYFEDRVDLPEDALAQKKMFVGRTVIVSEKGFIVREEMKANYYYVKVGVPDGIMGKDITVTVNLRVDSNPLTAPIVDRPSNLRVSGSARSPEFGWSGGGTYTAFTLLNMDSGTTLYERVLMTTQSHKTDLRLDEGSYIFAVKQSDGTGRYSPETKGKFRVDSHFERCKNCHGHGEVDCSYCHGSGHDINHDRCTWCHGHGEVECSSCDGRGEVKVYTLSFGGEY